MTLRGLALAELHRNLGTDAAQERRTLLEAVIPLLSAKEPEIASPAAWAVRSLGAPRYRQASLDTTQLALRACIDVYPDSPPGEARDTLADAILYLGGEEAWQPVSGNSHAVLAVLEIFRNHDGKCEFDLSIKNGADWVEAQPTLVLSRAGDGESPGPTVERPLPPDTSGKPWAPHSQDHMVRFDTADLAAGAWKVWVQGTAGDGVWRSEPKLFRVD